MRFETVESFTTCNKMLIDSSCADRIQAKTPSKFLDYWDMIAVTKQLKNLYMESLQLVPKQIEAACGFALTVLAPTAKERIHIIKGIVEIAGGAVGIGMILSGIGTMLGWGAGTLLAVKTFFVGTSMAGPVGWIAGGVGIAAIAGYFAVHRSNDEARPQKAFTVLKKGIEKAIPHVWKKYGEKISAYDYRTGRNVDDQVT